MFSKLNLYITFALIASCIATPVDKTKSRCKAVGSATKLLAYNAQDETTLFFKASSKGTNPKILAGNETQDTFQFYECDAPSDQYYGSQENVKYGQLHSVSHPGKCLTAGNVWVDVHDSAEGTTYKYIPGDDATIRLQDCQNTDSDVMRRQWMGLRYPPYSKYYNDCKLPQFFQAGHKKDTSLFSLQGNKTESFFTKPAKHNTFTAYLHNHVPKMCQ